MKTSILLSPSFSPSIPTLYSQVDSQCRRPPKLYPHIVSTPPIWISSPIVKSFYSTIGSQ
jgi:hypothetical protein